MNAKPTSQFLLRFFGVLLGLGFIAMGLFSLLSASPELEPDILERARGFGLVATVGGVLAIVLSVWAKDLSGIWCAPPSRRLSKSTRSTKAD